MKILLINQTFHPDVVATAQHLTDLALELVKAGHEVTVLTSRRSYLDSAILFSKREIFRGIQILRVKALSFGRSNRLSRILDALFMNLAFAWNLLWLPRFDKYLALTSPPLVGVISQFFAMLRRSDFIYWVMDLNPDQSIEAGWIRKDSFVAKVLEQSLQRVIKNSKTVIALDTFMKDRLILKGGDPEKIKVCPPWPLESDLETVPHQANPFRASAQLDGKFVVMYSGNLSICHPLETLLEAAYRLGSDQDIVFVFIGGGERVREVLDFKDKHHLENILYFPYQTRADLKYSLSAADLHVAVMGEPYVGIVHPSKIYGILKIGRPFVYIGPKESPIGFLTALDGVGYQVNHGETEKLVQIIQEEKNSRDKNEGRILPAQQKVTELYSKKILLPLLVDWIEES